MPETVLVVDDVETNRQILGYMLSANGFEVIEADTGLKAIECFSNAEPDLILMDINMPEMDGREAAKHIKGLEQSTYTPIIYVTALSEDGDLIDALASGGDDYITKPVNGEILLSKVRAHLRIRELSLLLEKKNQQLSAHNVRLKYEQDLVEQFFDRALSQNYLDPIYIKYYMSAMSGFNGDLLLAERAPNGDIFVIIGDFTGHGLTAAMGTLPVTQVFFNTVRAGASLSELLRSMNKALKSLLPVQMFFAANVIQLAKEGSRLLLWASGMPNVVWMNKKGELKQDIEACNTPLGILDDADFSDHAKVFNTEIGDQFYFCSDGVTEMSNVDGEMFGKLRLQNCLCEYQNNRIDQVMEELGRFNGRETQDDDITFVEITCIDHGSK